MTLKVNALIRTGIAAAGIVFVSSAWAAGDAAAGKTVFAAHCRTCHGAEGQGNPAIAKALSVDIKALGSADVQKRSDADLKANITSGVGKMKPVALSPADADNVVAYIRTLKQ